MFLKLEPGAQRTRQNLLGILPQGFRQRCRNVKHGKDTGNAKEQGSEREVPSATNPTNENSAEVSDAIVRTSLNKGVYKPSSCTKYPLFGILD